MAHLSMVKKRARSSPRSPGSPGEAGALNSTIAGEATAENPARSSWANLGNFHYPLVN